MLSDGMYAWPQKRRAADPSIKGGSLRAAGTITNWITGTIRSQYTGLLLHGARVRISDRTDLRVRWPLDRPYALSPGQRVIAAFSAEAVRLEAGLFRRSKQRWNRWIGRIVFVEPHQGRLLYTVKVHGEDWTLQGYGPVAGAQQACQPWDTVNIVMDPFRMGLMAVNQPLYDQFLPFIS